MKIYVCHSSNLDYKTELYEPLKREFGLRHQLILPHDFETDFNSRVAIESADMVLAEVSYASTGQGIELGWADAAGVPIVCIYKIGSAPSAALRHIAKDMLAYADDLEMVEKLARQLD